MDLRHAHRLRLGRRLPRERRVLGEWFARQPAPATQAMSVAQVHFIQSELLPTGPKYTTLGVAELSKET